MNHYSTFSQQPNQANNKLYEKTYDASLEFRHATNFRHLKVIKATVNICIKYADFPKIDIFTYSCMSSPPTNLSFLWTPPYQSCRHWKCLPDVSGKWAFLLCIQARILFFYLESGLSQPLSSPLAFSRGVRMSIFGITLLKAIDLFLND